MHIILYRNGALPPTTYTHPHFNISLFFQHLSSLHPSASPSSSTNTENWPLGSALLFSPAVTSTQTLLDKNNTYLSSLPTPTIHIASHQLLARGRGSNAWLSPAGSLSQSIHLRLAQSAGVPWNKLVFVQYLYALAVCEGVRDGSVLGDGDPKAGGEGEGWRVRIKWPNDVYALVGPKGAKENELEKKKVAGILVSMSFGPGGADIVIGTSLYIVLFLLQKYIFIFMI
jgi:biotin--protein ligase